MSEIYVSANDMCLGKKFALSNSEVGIICGNCNLTFKLNHLFKLVNDKRHITNCPHCGKWNKLRHL